MLLLLHHESDCASFACCQWDEFSLPELTGFLQILDREESSYIDQVRQRIATNRRLLLKQLARSLDGQRGGAGGVAAGE